MSFRLASGLRRVRTLAGARRLAVWLRSNDEDVSAVRRSGDLFDLESLTVRQDRISSSGVRGSLPSSSALRPPYSRPFRLLAGVPLLAFIRAESANQLVKRLGKKQAQLNLDL